MVTQRTRRWWTGAVIAVALIALATALLAPRLSDPGSAAAADPAATPAQRAAVVPGGPSPQAQGTAGGSDPAGTDAEEQQTGEVADPPGAGSPGPADAPGAEETTESPDTARETAAADESPDGPRLPQGGRRILPGHFLVAYYGTAGTGTMGVLGEQAPGPITDRLRAAAEPFGTKRRPVQIVYELIVTVADPTPGTDGDYSHDIARQTVQRYVRAARRHDALLVLDLQPGRDNFRTVARRWRWALAKPHVGLALDPEWRMWPGQVPGRTIGQVGAREVNQVSRWLKRLRKARDLPQKILLLHQFRTDMILNIDRVRTRRGLATIQHADGFGGRQVKLDTFHTVARPRQFHLGFKLFYDEDTDLFSPREVRRLRPRIDYVSYQ